MYVVFSYSLSVVNTCIFYNIAVCFEDIGLFVNLTLKEIAMSATVKQIRYPRVTISVDYATPIEEMIRNCNFESIYGGFTSEEFPSLGVDQKNVFLFLMTFEEDMPFAEILQKIDEQGYQAARLQELLAFAKKFQNLNLKFPIIAPFNYYREEPLEPLIPWLPNGTTQRTLGLVKATAQQNFSPVCRWLVVEK